MRYCAMRRLRINYESLLERLKMKITQRAELVARYRRLADIEREHATLVNEPRLREDILREVEAYEATAAMLEADGKSITDLVARAEDYVNRTECVCDPYDGPCAHCLLGAAAEEAKNRA